MGLDVGWRDETANYISFKTGGSQIALFPRADMAAALAKPQSPWRRFISPASV